MMKVLKTSIYVKKICKLFLFIFISCIVFGYIKKEYTNPDFGKSFGHKAIRAKATLQTLDENFVLCSQVCKESIQFLKALVFPEVMRYNSIKDGIETESLRTLYVQWGEEYANFSIGLFQMKPTFAVLVEQKVKQLLTDSINSELNLAYNTTSEELVRESRVERLQDADWQMVYLTAFICICNEIYKEKHFANEVEKLQWFATVYNAGFDKDEAYIKKKIQEGNFYLGKGMPEKKFKYAAIAAWYYNHNNEIGK